MVEDDKTLSARKKLFASAASCILMYPSSFRYLRAICVLSYDSFEAGGIGVFVGAVFTPTLLCRLEGLGDLLKPVAACCVFAAERIG